MNKLFQILVLSMMFPLLTGCGSDLSPFEDGHHRMKREKEKPVLKTFRMSFGGDFITESEEPLQRAKDGDTYVGINVFFKDKNKANAKEEKYAYGVFNKLNGINIDLQTGYLYRFEATILIEREDLIFDGGSGRVGTPFRFKDKKSNDHSYFEKSDIAAGEFLYTYNEVDDDLRNQLIDLHSGTANVQTTKSPIDDDYYSGEFLYPRVKRFYGEKRNFDPSVIIDPSEDTESSDNTESSGNTDLSGSRNNVEIEMNYMSFGLKFVLVSIPDGSINIKDITEREENTPEEERDYQLYLYFPESLKLNLSGTNTNVWESIYSLNNLTINDEHIRLRFTWTRENGDVKTFTQRFGVEANKKKVIYIKIEGDVSQTKSGNIVFTEITDYIGDQDGLEEVEVQLNKTFYK